MATANATNQTDSADDIRRRMAQIRQRLHQDMQGVVAGAEAASDWKHYVRLYPYAALVAVFGAGYLLVPRKRRSVTKTAEKAAEAVITKLSNATEKANGVAAETAAAVTAEPSKSRGLFGAAFAMASPLVLRVGQSYALSFVENWIAQQHAAAGPMPESGQRTGPSNPNPPGAPRRPGL